MQNLIASILFLSSTFLMAQTNTDTGPKLPLSEAAFDEWRSIDYQQLSNDGNFLAYTLNYDVADGKLVVLNLKTNNIIEIPRASKVSFDYDSKHLAFHITPSIDSLKALRRAKTKKEDLPSDSLGILNLLTFEITKIPNVKSYAMPAKAGNWIAFTITELPKKTETDTTDMATKKGKSKTKLSEDTGYPLALRNLESGATLALGNTKEYLFAENAKSLVTYTISSDSSTNAGVYWVDLPSLTTKNIFETRSKHKVKNLAIDKKGTQTAFVADLDTTKALTRNPNLFHWSNTSPISSIAKKGEKGIPNEWYVSEHFKPYFSEDGSKLYFGTNPKPIVADTALLPEEIVNVEVWHWQQDYIYPEQNIRANNDKKASFLSVKDLINGKITQLGDTQVEGISLADEGNATMALGRDDKKYRMMRTWDITAFDDLYVVDIRDGSKKLVAEKIKGRSGISPAGKYLYWYSLPDTAWYVYDIGKSNTLKLSLPATLSFADEVDDHPDYPNAYGMAGWTKNDERIWLYDRYDVWAFDPSGKANPINLTKVGRPNATIYRYINTDPDKKYIDIAEQVLLSSFQESTKRSGFSSLNGKKLILKNHLLTDHSYGNITKAQKANIFLTTRESFKDFPNLYTTDGSFGNLSQRSDANSQQNKYSWGTVEVVQWKSLDDIPLEGLLYKPENFNSSKKYPMIVYYYERNSDNLHRHWEPEPLRSIINFSMYVSDGYLVFVPDIVYKDGYPGESAFNAILPGVTALINKGFVQTENIGIQGHSWGGYQTAYMVTRTDMFKAAEAGAIVANMTSAYGGIRWGSGLARTFQYEKSQSRIGATLWENPQLYIENSPLFFADKIKTPLLLLHNDEDGAVPWYQGIEMYLAMRRLDKPCWMLNYNGEPHWPVKRENRVDFQIRMKQFFDHYLKAAPMPLWMKTGVPAIEKGINQKLELIDGQ